MLLTSLLAGACSGSKSSGQQPQNLLRGAVTSSSDSLRLTREYLTERIRSIYEHVFGLYGQVGSDFSQYATLKATNLDSLYCTQSWADLRKNVAQIDARKAENGNPSVFLVADYWIMGQDFHLPVLQKVTILEQHHRRARAQVEWKDFSDHSVEISLLYERGDWYIDNFIDTTPPEDGFWWKEAMQQYVRQNR